MIIFAGGICSALHAVIGKGSTQRLGDSTWTTDKECTVNFSEQQKKCYLNFHYNGANS